jgi:ElaA protein
MLNWHHKTFAQLSTRELYDILKIRQDVFVIEQQCIYPDIDDADKSASHLFAYNDQGTEISLYLRLFEPGFKSEEVSIGRILTSEASRGRGLGKALVAKALQVIESEYPNHDIKISAQVYLAQFYRDFDFVTTSEPYDEDGIQHIDMLRKSP